MNLLYESLESFKALKIDLYEGLPIIIPTDTNYNLACLPHHRTAVDNIFSFKNRKKDKPLSLFFANPEDWTKYGEAFDGELVERIVSNFWPGPLNIVLKKKTLEWDYMLNGADTIALGCVSNKTFQNFVKWLDEPIAITSANISGTADDMLVTEEVAQEHMKGKVRNMLLSSEEIIGSKSSTIIKVDEEIRLLREGDISLSRILGVVENVRI